MIIIDTALKIRETVQPLAILLHTAGAVSGNVDVQSNTIRPHETFNLLHNYAAASGNKAASGAITIDPYCHLSDKGTLRGTI